MPETEHKPVTHALYQDIENVIIGKNVVLEDSVNKFFDHIFPVMYKNIIYQGTPASWSHHFTHCLTKHRREVLQPPFGTNPSTMAFKLNKALAPVRTYVKSLMVILETLNTTDQLLIEDECRNALTRLQYCSHCRGLVSVKPCAGYCLDVMRGCLAGLSEVGPLWNDIITRMEQLVRNMPEINLEEMIKRPFFDMTEALFHFTMVMGDNEHNVSKRLNFRLDMYNWCATLMN